MRHIAFSLLAFIALCISEQARGQPLPPPGVSPEEKIEFLVRLDDEDTRVPIGARNRYFLGALADSSPKVRNVAAYGLRGDAYVSKLIGTLVTDPELLVRQTAAISLSHWITDNGQDTCTSHREVTKHLDPLLEGLKDDATAPHVVAILGGRYSGEKPLPCCMSARARSRVVAALREIEASPPKHTIASFWSSAIPAEALQNISECERQVPNPSIERTPSGMLRMPTVAAHVQR